MNAKPDDRWQTALHEAGHAVAAWVQGGRVHVIEARERGGVTRFDQLDPTAEAFVVAAGDAAEEIFADVPPPLVESTLVESDAAGSQYPPAADFATEPHAVRCGEPFDSTPTDDRRLALWAISGAESDPDRWAPRVYWARSVAAEIITDHRDKVLRLAEALYRRGTLFEEEIAKVLATE